MKSFSTTPPKRRGHSARPPIRRLQSQPTDGTPTDCNIMFPDAIRILSSPRFSRGAFGSGKDRPAARGTAAATKLLQGAYPNCRRKHSCNGETALARTDAARDAFYRIHLRRHTLSKKRLVKSPISCARAAVQPCRKGNILDSYGVFAHGMPRDGRMLFFVARLLSAFFCT